MITRQDAQRIIELIDQGCAASDPTEDIIRGIIKQMPHVTATDIAQVAAVHAEELSLDASVYAAQAEASKRIADIIQEIDQRCGGSQHTLGKAYILLSIWAQDGDTRAVELLGELDKATLVAGLGEQP
jgi:hypothetical protein